MDEIYVFGHKNPDTDSICSSIAYADFKRKMGFTKAKAYRLGKISSETKFVLDYFKVPEPPFLEDIKIKVGDLSIYSPMKFLKSDPIKYAWDILQENKGSRLIPVLNNDKHLEGVLSLGDITRMFMSPAVDDDSTLNYDILFKNLLYILGGKLFYGNYKYDKVEGNLYIGSSAIDSNLSITNKDILITAKLETAKKFALDLKCGCVILVNGQEPIGLEDSEAAIVVVDKNIYNAINIINQAISIGSIMKTKDILSFTTDNYVEDILEIMQTSSHRNFPVINKQGEFAGVISRRHLLNFNKKKVILIDHNEKSQSVEGIEQASILEVIDHHRVADIQTDSPLYIRSEPVGCSSTIIYKIYVENCIPIDKQIAGLMLSAILSDTLVFSSPTCTAEDENAAHNLAEIAEVNIGEYSREMFIAGSSLEGFTPNEILNLDLKRFSFGKYTFAIAQVTTIDFKSITEIKEDLINAMEEYRNKNSVDLVMLMITDIINDGSEIIVNGSTKAKDIVNKAFGLGKNDTSIFLDGVVSRKKQMVPKLTIASQTI